MNRTIRGALLLLPVLCLSLAGCGDRTGGGDNAKALNSLLAADRAFSGMSADKGARAAFLAYVADDAVLLPQGGKAVKGRKAIGDLFPADSKVTLTWTPQGGQVAGAGDMGYTWGVYEARGNDEKGRATVSYGKYITVWHRDAGGDWKVIADGGNTSPGP
ncbi:MAG: DUF4440 domain-containing protein [Gammaproteobacteria bacterium]